MDNDMIALWAVRQMLVKYATPCAQIAAAHLDELVNIILTYYPEDDPLRLEVERVLLDAQQTQFLRTASHDPALFVFGHEEKRA